MPEPSLNIALGSTFCRIGDIDFNLGQIGEFAEQAKRASADILLTPELSVTGYGPYPEVAALAETAGAGPIYQRLAEIAQASGVAIAAGFVEQHPHGPGISHYVVFPSGEFTVQRKFRVTPFEGPPLVSALPSLPLGGEPPEQLNFADLHFPTFKLKGVTCAVAICADSGIAGLQDFLDTLGAQVLFGPTGAGGNVNDRVRTSDLCTEEGRKKYLRALETAYSPSAQAVFDSTIHRRANVGVNQTGWDGRKCSHIGDSVIISPRGEILLMRGTFNLDFQKPAFRFGSIPLSHFE